MSRQLPRLGGVAADKTTNSCRLCLRSRELRESHIIPEYLYKPGYDEKHRLVKLVRGVPKALQAQKGLRQHLLCDDCEGFINDEYEKPALEFFNEKIPDTVAGNTCLIEGINYEPVRLMLLSVLWRASVATCRPWQLVDLGPTHDERLRRMILNRDAGTEDSYQTWGYLLLHPEERFPLRGTICPLEPVRRDARRIHRLIFGGCVWCFCVASHPMQGIQSETLLPTGSIRLGVFTMNEFKPFHNAMMSMVRAILQAEG